MTVAQHFGSISGGKDSQAVLCLMVERIERKGLAAFGNRAPRFLAADNGHENPITLDHIPEAIGRAVLRTEAALAAAMARDFHHRGDQS